jgi:hypothetical protein
MRGNSHVRFLGEPGPAMDRAYPTGKRCEALLQCRGASLFTIALRGGSRR